MTLSALQAQENVIRNPYVESYSSEILSLDKIVCSDTATHLYMDAYHLPGYWVKLAASSVLIGSDGKEYKLLSAENFELDKEVYMPESGHCAFILRFEPLTKDETLLDFSEGNFDGASKIKGISLVKKEKSGKRICCKLEGTVIDRPYSSRLKVRKTTESIRAVEKHIPIRNNKFSYELNCDEAEAFELIFVDEWNNASWRPVCFFAENGTISFTLYPQDRYKEYKVTGGGKLNAEYRACLEKEERFMSDLDSVFKERNALYNAENYYLEPLISVRKEINTASEANENTKVDSLWRVFERLMQTEDVYTPAAKENNQKEKDVFERWNGWKLDYAANHPTVVGYKVYVDLLKEKLYKEKRRKKLSTCCLLKEYTKRFICPSTRNIRIRLM